MYDTINHGQALKHPSVKQCYKKDNQMIKIEMIKSYTIPLYGNKHSMPYAKLLISDDIAKKTVDTKEHNGSQYFIFNRKRHYIRNTGTLYNPTFTIINPCNI